MLINSPETTEYQLALHSRSARQAYLLANLEDILPSSNGPASISRTLSFPSLDGRPKIGEVQNDNPSIRQATDLTFSVGNDGEYLITLKSPVGSHLQRPISGQSDFGYCGQYENFDSLQITLNPHDTSACVIYGITGNDRQELDGLSTASTKAVRPDAETFLRTCVYGYRMSVKHEQQRALAVTAIGATV
jgi:hypothetical protein